MSESLLTLNGNLSIGNNLAKSYTLTHVQNIGIPYNTLSPLSISVTTTTKYVVLEFRCHKSGSIISTNIGNPSGYVSNIIIPYGSDATTGFTAQQSSNIVGYGITATWNGSSLNLSHSVSSASITIYALVGFFE